MPRRSRIILSGVPAHIVQRGNNRQPCFFQDQDRSFFLFHLGRWLQPSRCALHAYCLMTNHIHLLLTSESEDGCARLMKHVGQLHAQYVIETTSASARCGRGVFAPAWSSPRVTFSPATDPSSPIRFG